MRTTKRWVAVLGGMVLASACGEDIGLSPAPEEETPAAGKSRVTSTPGAGDVWTTVVDATSSEVWVGVDLDTRAEADAATDAAWDLSFQRFHVRTRGGTNGSGGVRVAVLRDTDFAALGTAPASGYQEDRAAEGTTPGTVFESEGGWYDYAPSTHTLSPKPGLVYVVRGDQGRYFKVQMVSYYDAAGTSGVMTWRWAELAAPAAP